MAFAQPHSICFRLLGGFTIRAGETAIPPEQFRLRKARSLLKLLALAPEHRLHRDQLIEALWPEADPETASNSLNQAIYAARRVFKSFGLSAQHILQLNEEILRLCAHLDTPLWVDVAAFETAAAKAHASHDPAAFQAALDLYAGDLLPEDPYEDWASAPRESLRQECLRLRLELADLLESRDEYPIAIPHLQQALDADPACEEAHAGLMRLYALTGQRSAALAQYETCRAALEQELGVSPGPATTSLYQQIAAGELAAQPPPTPSASPARSSRLPTFLIPFVGRRNQLASIRERLADPACRLLTLVGPGGTGKTRLAVEGVSSLSADFPDGIFFVPLAGLQSSDAIVPAIAQALGITFFDTSEPHLQLIDYLQNKSLLLVLDNFEHLLGAESHPGKAGAGIITQMLEAAPGVKVLATSRARLNLLYETLLPIPGMTIPPERSVGLEEALQFSGVRLFLEGARRILPEYVLTDQDLGPILAICRLVQGMPLGILLAAGWLEMLTPLEIAAEMRKDLDFLASRWQDLPERQRSLRGVFDHSWRLLGEQERQAFAALSSFRGFSAEAAGKVAEAPLPLLASLVGKSLVQRSPQGRFEVHELLRQYAAEKLAGQPATQRAVRDRHCRYFCEFLAEREHRLLVKNEPAAMQEVAGEIDNIRLAWDWAIERGLLEELDRSRTSLNRFFILQGRFFEGKHLFEDAARRLQRSLIDRSQEQDSNALRLTITHMELHEANFCINLHLIQRADEIHLASLPIVQELGDRESEATCWRELGHRYPIDDPETGYLKAIRIDEELKDVFSKARTLNYIGVDIISEGKDLPRAKRYLQEALSISRELDSPYLLAWVHYHLGNLCSLEEKYPEAEAFYLKGIEILQELGMKYATAVGYWMRSRNSFRQGTVELAKQWMRTAIGVCLDSVNYAIAAEMILSLVFFCWKLDDMNAIPALLEELKDLLLRTRPPKRIIFEGGCEVYRGIMAWSQQDLSQARTHFRLALQKFRHLEYDSYMAFCVLPMAEFFAQHQRVEQALELVEYFNVPSARGWLTAIDEVHATISKLEAALPPELASAARERSQQRVFSSLVDVLIAEWQNAG